MVNLFSVIFSMKERKLEINYKDIGRKVIEFSLNVRVVFGKRDKNVDS